MTDQERIAQLEQQNVELDAQAGYNHEVVRRLMKRVEELDDVERQRDLARAALICFEAGIPNDEAAYRRHAHETLRSMGWRK